MSQSKPHSHNSQLQEATFGMGCFWCVEPIFEQIDGVVKVVPGYAGGHKANPTYDEVCRGNTGHIEVIRITYDPGRVSFKDLLVVFFRMHDPTSVDQQGADRGEQYRSIIFTHSDEQRKQAQAMIRELDAAKAYRSPIVTHVKPLTSYYEAEDYHHEYFRRNPNQGYCRMVIAPKVKKFEEHFQRLIRKGN
ncbi:MAG: peptide-methionine (S)-S-oxide reductase [Bacteroidia bacterium]|nr:MAG: peptide-methionine (S)-S-oxide reductase [Bacteroidia bacterium]